MSITRFAGLSVGCRNKYALRFKIFSVRVAIRTAWLFVSKGRRWNFFMSSCFLYFEISVELALWRDRHSCIPGDRFLTSSGVRRHLYPWVGCLDLMRRNSFSAASCHAVFFGSHFNSLDTSKPVQSNACHSSPILVKCTSLKSSCWCPACPGWLKLLCNSAKPIAPHQPLN